MPTRPPIDQQVTWIYAQDLDATLPFYREVLGLVQVLDQGLCKIFRLGPDSFLGVCRERPGRKMNPDGVVITMVTQDVDGWYDYMVQNGAQVMGKPELSETFNVYCFFARDPNGYLIEFQRFQDPAWPSPLGGDA